MKEFDASMKCLNEQLKLSEPLMSYFLEMARKGYLPDKHWNKWLDFNCRVIISNDGKACQVSMPHLEAKS